MAYDDEMIHNMRNKNDRVKKNLINDLYQGTGSAGTNEELDHTESDEGIN